jgi:glycosyltransferase involved in cell wall biosynthesis
MSDATLVIVDARGPADGATVAALAGGGPVLDLSGGRGPAGLARLLERILTSSDASAFVVVDLARGTPPATVRRLADELGRDVGAVGARVLDRDGERVVFDGGGLDLRAGLLRFGEHQPAVTRRDGPRASLWFDPSAFAISRATAETIVALAVEPALEPLSVGWQIWRAGGSILTSASVLVRASGVAARTPDPAELRMLLGALLEPDTLAASGIRLDGVLDRVLTARLLLVAPRARSDAEILAANDPGVGETPESEPSPIVVRDPARRRVTLLCSDSIGPSMAGPGIRSVELARALGGRFDVTVLARQVAGPVDLDATIGELSHDRLRALAAGPDPLVLQGPLTDWFPEVLAGNAPIAIDLYDPMNLEALEHPDAATNVPYTVRLLVDQIARGDYFMCASERQRDYWLGMLAACGRVDAAAYGEDPDLRALIDVVPFGLPREAPIRSGPGPREEIEGIGPDDPLFVWNGGLWDWFDPETLLAATALARRSTPNIRVLFMGVQRPGEDAPSAAAQSLMRRSDELGLTDVHVFFRSWTPYETRHNTYLDATAAVSLHHAHLESRFSFRTRLLDCIWATLPILGTEGDVLAELVRDEHLGLTVRPGDVDGVADALVALATDRDGITTRARIELATVAPRFRWSAATLPLSAWLDRAERRPRHARPNLPAMPMPKANQDRWLGPQAYRVARAVRSRLR